MYRTDGSQHKFNYSNPNIPVRWIKQIEFNQNQVKQQSSKLTVHPLSWIKTDSGWVHPLSWIKTDSWCDRSIQKHMEAKRTVKAITWLEWYIYTTTERNIAKQTSWILQHFSFSSGVSWNSRYSWTQNQIHELTRCAWSCMAGPAPGVSLVAIWERPESFHSDATHSWGSN